MEQKSGIVGVLLIPALAIGYYFGVALPENQKARLAFEKQKYEDQQKAKKDEKEEAAQRDEYNQSMFNACSQDAETNYWTYIKLNKISSRPDTDGTTIYVAPQRIWDTAAKQKKDFLAECAKKYSISK